MTAQPVARRWAGLILLLTLGAVVWGTLSLFALPSGIYPDVEFPRLVVVAHAGDLPPEVMQTAATGPLEQALATVPGVRRLNARTIRGATELNAQFAPGTDMWRALQLAQTQVAEIRSELPEGTELTVERVTPTALPIVTFNVSGSSDPRELYEVAARTIRPALTRVPGVGSVDVQGGLVREVEVVMKPAALAAAHLTPSGLADRVSQVVTLAAAGRALDEHQVLTVMAGVEPSSPEALAALPVDGVPLAAVADVFDGSEDRTTTVTGPAGDAVVITVSRAEGASAPDVVAGAQQVLAGLARDHVLPAGVKVETVYDQAVLIEDALHGVRDAILLGVALSLVVLAVFLRDARAGAAAAVAVPVTLLATFGVMRLFGQTLNLMSMGGLAVAIGLVVDDAIVIVEAIVRRQEEGLGVSEAAARGTRDLFAAVVGTTATTVVVFAPLALIAGVVGAFFGALAVTLSIAVVLSLVFAVTLVPLVATALLRPRAPAERPGGALAAAYGRVLRRVVRHPVLSVVAVVAAAVVGVLAARATPTGFLPAMDEGAVVVDFFLPAGTSLDETDRIARRIDAVLAARPYVATFTRRTGTEMGPATATVQNRGDILVRLVPRDRRPSVYAVMDDLRGRLAEAAPEARVELVQVLQDVLNDLAGNPNPIEVKVFGRDPAELDRIAPEIAAKLEGLDALEDLFNGVEGRVPELRADVDVAAADRLKVTPAQVTEDLRVSLAGRVAAQLRRGDVNLGVRVRAPDDVRFRPEAIESLPLAYGGGAVPASAVARFSKPVGPSELTRENLTPMVAITAALKEGADLGGVTAEVARRVEGVTVPPGYRVEVAGQQQSAHETQLDLARVFGLGVALVLAILLVQLRQMRLALVVLVGAPLALVGAVVTLWALDIPLNASSLMGCILLAGLVVKNGILLLEHAQHAGGDFGEGVVAAGERRLRPILMTTAATIVGLLPLALGFGAGTELQRPLAVATIGGLVLSTLVTLFAVPALATAVMRRRPDAS